jgi:competence protein ComEC
MREQDKGRERPRAGARLWPTGIRAGAAAPGFLDEISDWLRSAGTRIREWLAFDLAPGRLVPWIPIAFGIGVALYFTADTEPALWAALIATILALSICIAARARLLAWPLMIGVTALALGFTLATWKTMRVAHPVLTAPAYGVMLSGFVETREERERSDRITIRIHSISGPRLDTKLQRVRLSVRKGTAPAVASFIEARARLSPPLTPLRPGGYDFARDYYFQRLGATGFALGNIKQATPPHEPALSLRFAASIAGIRDAIDARIRAVLPGDRGAIASALITGKRDAISSPVNEAMYVSSLAHVLSISGYHMAVVAGVVFFLVRAGLALIPGVASRHPIKKWGALAALVVAAFYLLLSGAEVATQRSFIMTAIVLIGVMCDRPALTLRTISVAALVLLAISPEAIVHPSFQMSFAATLALVAAYERGLPWLSAEPDTPLGARFALWGGREIVALLVASLVAGAATTLFAAYHFHRLAPYGVLANLAAMPVVSIWVMPAGLLGLVAIPFGLDKPVWWLMGEGIDWMITVALFVASLPGAIGRIGAFGILPLLIGTAGLVVICLLRSPLRWSGAALVMLCILFAWKAPRPDVLISADAGMVGVRDASGTLRVLSSRRDEFVLKEWLAADGDARSPKDPTLADGTRCDSNGCVARLADGRAVALSLTAAGLAEDCEAAALVVTARKAPPGCAATVIDRERARTDGAMAAIRDGGILVLQAARPPTSQRPWMTRRSAPSSAGPARNPAPAPVDSTPRPQDLDPDELGSEPRFD